MPHTRRRSFQFDREDIAMTTPCEFEPRHSVQSFCFWHSDDGEMCAITFEFQDERPAQVALPIEVLPTFENQLMASEERCRALQRPVERGSGSSPNTESAPKAKYSDVGPVKDSEDLHVLGLRVTHVSLFEQLDGGAVGLRFDHPDGAATRALMPIDYVPVFLQKIRDAQAVAQARKVQNSS